MPMNTSQHPITISTPGAIVGKITCLSVIMIYSSRTYCAFCNTKNTILINYTLLARSKSFLSNQLHSLYTMIDYVIRIHKYLMTTVVYDTAPQALCAIVLLVLAVFLPQPMCNTVLYLCKTSSLVKGRVIASSNSFISCPKHDSALTWHRSCISWALGDVLRSLTVNMPYDGITSFQLKCSVLNNLTFPTHVLYLGVPR